METLKIGPALLEIDGIEPSANYNVISLNSQKSSFVPDHRIPSKRPSASAYQNGNDAVRHLDRLALLAHQLVTPLSTISALAQGLVRRSEKLNSQEVREKGEKIWQASRRLHELIETIMSYTRANAGAITPTPRPFNLKSAVIRICSEQRQQQPSRTFRLATEELPELFIGDPILLEQALIILISNAMKYSSLDRPISIIGSGDEKEVSIRIEDEGIGVPERDLPFLMQPFFRARNAKHMPGTGLGLSLVWHILQLHGGTVRIESAEGQGTTITMVLPRGQSLNEGGGI